MRAGVRYRFLLVSAAAFGLDALIAIWLRTEFGWAVWTAAAVSFLTVAVAAYPLHEYWTFSREGGRGSARRLAQTVAAACVSLCVRIGVVAGLERAWEPDALLAAGYLLAGAACSLTANYVFSRIWVFRGA